jgi:hypothetical protein
MSDSRDPFKGELSLYERIHAGFAKPGGVDFGIPPRKALRS